NHSGEPSMLPFQPGQIFINASPVFNDFSVGPNSNNPCRSQVITVSATLVDFYGENIDNGALQLTAIGAGLADPPPDPSWDPNWVQITNSQGQAVWYIEYPIQLCPKTEPQTCPTEDNDCTLCDYDEFSSSVWVDLIFPVQTQSNQLEVTLMRSGGECENCP
ncbi:MAG: hypothetical protein GXO91_09070, partial [FCB group bacterium]|nr:hypothetical protein [FCB group bacterium]